MWLMFQDGPRVEEIFASDFKTFADGIAKASAPVKLMLNVQGGESVSISCDDAFACDYITFMAALDSEMQEHGIAVVLETDYRPGTVENTIFIVCDDYFSPCAR